MTKNCKFEKDIHKNQLSPDETKHLAPKRVG